MKKVKPFRERKTPYPDTISDMKRPFDHPRDMPTHTGMFPLHFQKQLMTYYDESIAYMCDTKDDYRKMQNHFEGHKWLLERDLDWKAL
eukprot:1849843-Amphidinium_carterae.1